MRTTIGISAVLVTILLSAGMASGQDVISTVAGGGPNGIPDVNANINQPYTVTIDLQGNLYFAAAASQRVFKIAPTGVLTVVAGTGVQGYSGDGGQAASAKLNTPVGVAVDHANPANVYFTDNGNCLVRKVSQSTGVITTIAGLVNYPTTGAPYTTCGYKGDGGPANAAELYSPDSIAIDPRTNDLYFVEYNNGRLRKVAGGTPTGTISTVAGGGGSTTASNNCGGSPPYGDTGAANQAYLCYPQGLGIDTSVTPVNLFIGENDRCTVREVVGSTGKIYTVAGQFNMCGFVDGVKATAAKLYSPWQMQVSVSGSITTIDVADYANARVRQFTLTYASGVPDPGNITTIAGGAGGFCGDGGAALKACMYPTGIVSDTSGNLYIADYGNDRIRKVAKSTLDINTIAGWGYNNGTVLNYSDPANLGTVPALGLSLFQPGSVTAEQGSTKVYIGGTYTPAVYEFDSGTGLATTVAGNGVPGYAGDGGLATAATVEVNIPQAPAFDTSGNIYFPDQTNCVIRKITASTGDISTVVGGTNNHQNGCGFTGDGGLATEARINGSNSVAIDANNNMYIADTSNCNVRKVVLSTGIITTYAGIYSCTYNGDNGLATSTALNRPTSVAVDANGDVYIADYYNQRVRKVDAVFGTITTIAGNGTAGYNGDGVATETNFNGPARLSVDANGNVFVADQYNNELRWVDPAGTLVTFAGLPPTTSGGNYNYTGDGGKATLATMRYPTGITQDDNGNFFAADSNNNVIRQVTVFAGFGRSTGLVNFTEPQQIGTTSGALPVFLSAIGPIDMGAITMSGPFTEIDDCMGTSLTVGQTCEIDVFFTPTKGGPMTGKISIASNAYFPTQGSTINLEGTGAGLSLSGPLVFQPQLVGGTTTQTLTVSNSGVLTKINKIYLTSPANFKISGGTCPVAGGTLATGTSCTLAVAYSATTAGVSKDTLVISSSDVGNPLLAGLTGTSVTITVTPAPVAFGSVPVGNSKTVNVTIKNTASTGALTLTPTLTATGFSILTTGNTCTAALAPSASCVLPVQFAPKSVASYTGTLTLKSNGGTNATVAVTGAGVADIKVSPTSIAFASITHGTGETTTVVLTNGSNQAVTLATAFSGTGASAFSISTTGNTCGASLAANSTCNLPVKFAPAAAQAYSATLTITTNGGSNPAIALTGTGK